MQSKPKVKDTYPFGFKFTYRAFHIPSGQHFRRFTHFLNKEDGTVKMMQWNRDPNWLYGLCSVERATNILTDQLFPQCVELEPADV